jgi:hypothetical protein
MEVIKMNDYERLRRISESLKNEYPNGTRVQLINMEDEKAVPSGTRGTVMAVDSMATIHVNWDNGSTLGVAYGEDHCRKLTQEELEEEQLSNQEIDDNGMTMKM